ncbi:hypothetical protein [Microbacterium maritypicum]
MRSNLEVYGFAHPDADTWIIHYPWATNPLPLNGSHGHPHAYHRKARAIRDHGYRGIQHAHIPPLGRCTAQLTWWVSRDRVRDQDNLADLEKRLFDALVLAKVVEDDRPELMAKPRGVIRHVRDSAGLVTEACFTLAVTRSETHA